MILIRGIRGEAYARKIEKGVVDCRDILSALLQPPVTGYEYSDYYEKNLVKALAYFSTQFTGQTIKDIHDPDFLYSLLIDYYIPHIYLTYFHILNTHSLEWLDKFENDYQFIALNVKIDRLTKTAIGTNYFGGRMSYVDSISRLKQEEFVNFYAACMCSLEKNFKNSIHMYLSLNIYNTLAFPLLCREKNEKFTDIENEFRIIAYDCPEMENGNLVQTTRKAVICGKTGIKYNGILNAGENSIFHSNMFALSNPEQPLRTILGNEEGMVTIDSKFKSINICDISDEYVYLGGKADCAKYIEKMLMKKPKDIYVDKTILRTHKFEDVPDAVFLPGYQNVNYVKP